MSDLLTLTYPLADLASVYIISSKIPQSIIWYHSKQHDNNMIPGIILDGIQRYFKIDKLMKYLRYLAIKQNSFLSLLCEKGDKSHQSLGDNDT